MGATVTNENRGITTKTSDHTYATLGPTDVCMNPPVTAPVPHPNYVKTDKAVEHTSGKTLFQNGNVVRVAEALMASDPAHGDIGAGGGVVSHTYRMEARATSGSPNVRVEGLPPARTSDPTTQNHANTVGKIFQVVPPALLTDNPAEAYKVCSYDTSTIKSQDPGIIAATDSKPKPAVTMPSIEVKRGSRIIIEAKRKNAKVPNTPPECFQPPHMKWKVTRTGGTDWKAMAIPGKYEEFSGDTLILNDWLPSLDIMPGTSTSKVNESDTAKDAMVDDKNTYAAENASSRGSSRVEGADTQAAYKQVKVDRERRKTAMSDINKLADFAQFLVAWRAFANPIRVAIVGNACSGAVTYEVLGMPDQKYEFKIPLEGLYKAVQWINRAMAPVRTIGQLANVRVENSVVCPGPGLEIGIGFEWKEGDDKDLYYCVREAVFKIGGTIFEWKFKVSVPLVNFLAIIPFGGAVASRAVGWVIQRIGAEASCGFGVDITLKAEASMSFNWTKQRGWKWEAALKFPIDCKIYGFIKLQWRDNLHIEGQIMVVADPALKLEGTSAGLILKSDKFKLKVGLSGQITVNVWFYSYENKGEWFPECLTCEVPEGEIWKIISN